MTTRAAVKAGLRWGAMACAVALALSTAGASEPQVRIEVSRPFLIGVRSFAPGVIQVHRLRDFTPTTALLEVWVDGECLGMVRARIATAEVAPRTTEAMFHLRPDGRLVMIGYRVAGGSSGRTYRFELPFESPVNGLPAAVAAALGTY